MMKDFSQSIIIDDIYSSNCVFNRWQVFSFILLKSFKIFNLKPLYVRVQQKTRMKTKQCVTNMSAVSTTSLRLATLLMTCHSRPRRQGQSFCCLHGGIHQIQTVWIMYPNPLSSALISRAVPRPRSLSMDSLTQSKPHGYTK